MAFRVITPTRFGASELDILPSLTTIRTTSANTRDILKNIDIANDTATTVTVDVYLVPSGDSASADNLLIPGVSIPGHSVFQWTGTQIANAGGTIQAGASIAGVTLTASGGVAGES